MNVKQAADTGMLLMAAEVSIMSISWNRTSEHHEHHKADCRPADGTSEHHEHHKRNLCERHEHQLGNSF